MIRLFVAELNRYRSRRALKLTAVLLLLGIALAGLLLFVKTTPPESFRLTDLADVFPGTAALLIILGVGLGASFVGAEWTAGTMTTLLTWEPRRLRVAIVKASAGALFVFVAAFLFQALLGIALAPSALLRGTTHGADWEWFLRTAGIVLRGATVAALAQVIGYSIASLARNTAAAVVAGFVYLVFIENLIRGLKPQWQTWLIAENSATFIVGQGQVPEIGTKSVAEAGLLLAAYAGILLVLAVITFRSRDVT